MQFPLQTLDQLKPLIQGFRKRAGLTQAAMAEKLGITQQSYAQMESNLSTTSVERLYTILRLLNVELSFLPSDAVAVTIIDGQDSALSGAKNLMSSSATATKPTSRPAQRTQTRPSGSLAPAVSQIAAQYVTKNLKPTPTNETSTMPAPRAIKQPDKTQW